MTKKTSSKTKSKAKPQGTRRAIKKTTASPKGIGARALGGVVGGAAGPSRLPTIHENIPLGPIHPARPTGGTGIAPPPVTGNPFTRGATNAAKAWTKMGPVGKVGAVATLVTTAGLGAGLVYRPIKNAIDKKKH
jgi:hypothetical protein